MSPSLSLSLPLQRTALVPLSFCESLIRAGAMEGVVVVVAADAAVRLQPDGNGNSSSRVLLMEKGVVAHQNTDEGMCSLLVSGTDSTEAYSRPLSCCGCGIGWLFFILGFAFPPLWYCATVLFLRKYHLKEPRERAGLAASAIAALVFSVAAFIATLAMVL